MVVGNFLCISDANISNNELVRKLFRCLYNNRKIPGIDIFGFVQFLGVNGEMNDFILEVADVDNISRLLLKCHDESIIKSDFHIKEAVWTYSANILRMFLYDEKMTNENKEDKVNNILSKLQGYVIIGIYIYKVKNILKYIEIYIWEKDKGNIYIILIDNLELLLYFNILMMNRIIKWFLLFTVVKIVSI